MTSNPAVTGSPTVHPALTPPTVDAYARKALVAACLGYAVDGFDLLILSFILVPLSATLQLSPPEAGSLITWTLIGAVAGGFLAGPLSDRYGRVRVLSWTILLFAGFTGLCAFSQGYWDLLAYRTMAGIGLGGEFGIGMTLAAEAWPAHKRARATSYVGLGWQAGVLIAALVSPALIPHIGWRGMFLVGILPSFVAFGVRHYLGEPAVFVAASKMEKINPFSVLFADRDAIRATAGIAFMTSAQNFGYYGMMIWLPAYLSSQLHFSLTQSALWISSTIAGGAFGMYLFGQLADRIGRKPLFIAFQAGAMAMAFVYPQVRDPTTLLLVGAITGIFLSGMIGGYGALIAESYPTQGRATAQNVLFNIGRGVGGFGPLVVGLLAARYSLATALSSLVAIWALDIIATTCLIKERKGQPLVS
ncbi:MAG: MFS transporter [Xanthobacteraceae bacterium]|jgi:MFS family permease